MATFTYSKQEIQRRLESLPSHNRIAFGLSCCERMLRNYVAFKQKVKWGDERPLQQALDELWKYVDTISAIEVLGGGTLAAGGGTVEVLTVGSASPIAVPATLAGTAVAGHGITGINNWLDTTRKESTTYQTYTKPPLDPQTDAPYSGRTSGTGTPRENVAQRDANHHMNETHGPAQLDKSSSNPEAIRGREQQLIEANGGAQSTGGTSGNKINGVSPTNPKGQQYRDAADKEFGDKK